MNSILLFVSLIILCASATSIFNDENPSPRINRIQRLPFRLAENWDKKLFGPFGSDSHSSGPPNNREKIVGGEVAEVGRYPYMVSLLNDEFPFCGGTLIDPEWVISAAHCAGSATHILIGHHDFNNIPDNAEKISVSYEIKHPSFNSWTLDSDILMIKLTEESSFPVTEVETDDENIPEGTDVTTIGWGTTSFQGSTSDVLREVIVQTVSNENCGYAYDGGITDTMMCAAANGKDACQGDSGGPLMIKGSDFSSDVQVGIVSWGIECAHPDYPGVYASLAGMGDFIADAKNSTGPPDDDDDDYYNNDYTCSFPDDGFDYSECDVDYPCWIDDRYCDGFLDTPECNYDGGDCSGSSIIGHLFNFLRNFLGIFLPWI